MASPKANPERRGSLLRVSSPGVRLLLFAAAREAAGTRQIELTADTVGDALSQARARFGGRFGEVLDASRIWVNGDEARPDRILTSGDEVAVLPPVSGG